MQNIIDNDKSLLTIRFDRKVLLHLKCKSDDYLLVFQSNFNTTHFLMVKSDTGYRIKKVPNIKKMYEINIYFKFTNLSEFSMIRCTYFMKKNNTIRIIKK